MRNYFIIGISQMIAVALVFGLATNFVPHVDPPVDIHRKDHVRYRLRTNRSMGQPEHEALGNVWKSDL